MVGGTGHVLVVVEVGDALVHGTPGHLALSLPPDPPAKLDRGAWPEFARQALSKTPAPASEMPVISCLLFESKLNLL